MVALLIDGGPLGSSMSASHLLATFSTAAANVCTCLHHVVITHPVAIRGTGCANLSTHSACPRVKFGGSSHESGRRETDIRAILQHSNM